jgi:hypothetical protein
MADDSTVVLADTTPGATIYYTTDGSAPTTSSPSGTSVTISGTVGSPVTVEALATAPGHSDSAVATFTYPIAEGLTATPSATPASGSTVPDNSTVTLADTMPGATIYYTTDGSIPDMSSPSGTSVTITGAAGSQVAVNAFAMAPDLDPSPIVTFSYIVAPPPVHRAPPPPPCITTAGLPPDFTLVSCVASLPGTSGTASISYNTAKTSGQPPARLVVYQIANGEATHYLPTTISANEAEVLDAPAGTYAVLLSTRTYTDMAQEPQAVQQAVELLTAAGAAWGFEDATFQPDADATQGQVAQMVDVVLGLPVSAPPANAAAWATPYVEAMDSALGQTPYMVLSPANSGAAMTQGQFAAVLAQALHLVTGPVTEDAASAALAKASLFSVTDASAPITRGQVCEVLAAWIATQAPPAP